MKILGIFYSNNAADPKIMRSSLRSLEAAVAASKGIGEVRTCCWAPIEGNPFKESPAIFRLGVHLSISMQILKVMYEAIEAKETWDAVAYLEQDVLYPEWYFRWIGKLLEQNPQAEGVINLNYIGMRRFGFVRVNQRDEPMHQFSQRWDSALQHQEMVVRTCIRLGARCVEPDDKSKFVKIPYDENIQPSVHINHDKHFTSHNNIYSKEPWVEVHPYWGDFRQFYPEGLL